MHSCKHRQTLVNTHRRQPTLYELSCALRLTMKFGDFTRVKSTMIYYFVITLDNTKVVKNM